MTSRRRLLQSGLAGAALLSGGALGLALQPGATRDPREPLLVLSPRAFAVLAAIVDRWCPAAPGLPDGGSLRVPEKVDRLLDRLDPKIAGEVERALLLLENGLAGLLLDGRARPFTTLDGDAQDRALERWRTSGLSVRRQAHKAIRGLVDASYWSDPATFPFVGYPGPPRFPT